MANPFASSWAKLDRAEEHAQAANAQIARIMENYRTTFKTDPKSQLIGTWQGRPVYRLIVRIASIPPFTSDESLLIGEAVQGFRAALDHMAWVIVKRSGKKLKALQQRTVAFPMARSRASFLSGRNRLLPGVRDELFAFVEVCQPYHRSTVGRVMRSLRNLSDSDKHRFITPVLVLPMEWNAVVQIDGVIVTAQRKWRFDTVKPRALKLNAPFYEVDAVISDQGADVKMQSNLKLFPSLPGVLDTDVEGHFRRISAMCAEILSEFEGRL